MRLFDPHAISILTILNFPPGIAVAINRSVEFYNGRFAFSFTENLHGLNIFKNFNYFR